MGRVDEFVPTVSPEEMLKDPWASRAILREALDWLSPNAEGLDEDGQRLLARQVGVKSGLYAAEYPIEYGGWSIPELVAVELREEAAATGLWYSRYLLSNFHGPSRLLMQATPEQRERWLRPLVEGRWTRCLAMTEESGGSDLGAMRTTATWTGDGWELNGRKFLIGNAADAEVAIVLAHAVGGRASGPSFFIFRTTAPGWRVLRRLPGMDPKYKAYEVEIDGVRLPESAVIGGSGQVGAGIGKVSEGMAYGRLAMAARAVGLARYALGVARRHASERVIGGGRLSDNQYIREFLVRSDVAVEASRCLVRRAAAALDEGAVAVREAAMAKLFATESACQVADDAMQTLGGRGWLAEYRLEQVYRELRAFRIADGASELLKETIFHLPPVTPLRTE
ncbi:acyl-CoA dehydrogenase family protein [Nocardiopsis sp. NPDC049922]|uniref:acyl-CoA dehydrogenase family protein n=1 Tax=Nocardiopsis sp. NPDC049922 TaxID=3155157 RepID=UPI0033EC9778